VLALGFNLLLLIGLLSILQATLTLPGMAALALTVGMAIDANVLINERIRDELRSGAPPQLAIHAGYERAFGTIVDSNITTLIAGIALFAFGSGPVKGFAVVLCLGILTSVFTATFVSRGMVNFMYGNRRLTTVPIGKIWIPKNPDKNKTDLSATEDLMVVAKTAQKENEVPQEVAEIAPSAVPEGNAAGDANVKPEESVAAVTKRKRKSSDSKQSKKK
jgi:preprotein translocase subunit SecD